MADCQTELRAPADVRSEGSVSQQLSGGEQVNYTTLDSGHSVGTFYTTFLTVSGELDPALTALRSLSQLYTSQN